MLGASTGQQVGAGAPRTHLKQLETEHVVERNPGECRFVPEYTGTQGTVEPVAGRLVARWIQASLLHEKTSEVLMLQVKYAAKCPTMKRL
jgi:hypothetical protein